MLWGSVSALYSMWLFPQLVDKSMKLPCQSPFLEDGKKRLKLVLIPEESISDKSETCLPLGSPSSAKIPEQGIKFG